MQSDPIIKLRDHLRLYFLLLWGILIIDKLIEKYGK